jgi:thiol-disulfide isomerase/thioredoxin
VNARAASLGWLLVLSSCDTGKPSAPLPSRVESVAARKSDESAADFCDVAPAAASAPTFVLPSTEGTPVEAGGPRWINVWATWCPPCTEELPRLSSFVTELARAGSPVTLQLLSVDSSASAVDSFAARHPEVRGTLRIADVSALEPWLAGLGLDKGATVPVHVFVAADGKVLCARTGAVRDSDLPAIKKLLRAR